MFERVLEPKSSIDANRASRTCTPISPYLFLGRLIVSPAHFNDMRDAMDRAGGMTEVAMRSCRDIAMHEWLVAHHLDPRDFVYRHTKVVVDWSLV